jgi:acyl carrier protein
MEIEKFIYDIKEQFIDLTFDVNEDTQFKNLKSWDSMTALMVISMIDDTYGIGINGDDLRSCDTIKDLYDLVFSKRYQK